MIKQKTALERVTEVLQSISKLEKAHELIYQLEHMLPSRVETKNTELIDLYKSFGLIPNVSKATTGFIEFEAIKVAQDLLFKQQKQELLKTTLEILGFTQEILKAESTE
jgi:hypothetical protein